MSYDGYVGNRYDVGDAVYAIHKQHDFTDVGQGGFFEEQFIVQEVLFDEEDGYSYVLNEADGYFSDTFLERLVCHSLGEAQARSVQG